MSIENTADRDPLIHLVGGMGGTDRYIEEMERHGQAQFVHSDRLPTQVNWGTDEDFLALGFTFGAPDPQDRLFRPATLPEGWKRKGTAHSMWSEIVDHKGRKRVSIFYKAAFYDRDAFMSLVTPMRDLVDLLDQEIRELPVDDWRTPSVWVEILTEQQAKYLEEAQEWATYGTNSSAEFRARKRAEICGEQLAKMKAMLT